MQTIYLTQNGCIRLSDAPGYIFINATQQQYENILGKALFLDNCITPLKDYAKYKNGDNLQTQDIPEEAEFEYVPDQYSNCNFTEEELLQHFIQENKKLIMESFEKEIEDNNYYINGKIIHYTINDRHNLQILVTNNKPFYFEEEYYSAEALKNLYYTLENEVLKITFYKEILLRYCNSLTTEDRLNYNFIDWGFYNDEIDKEMQKYEPII